MWLVHLCCVIASILVNMLFLKFKSELFIIRLFFSTYIRQLHKRALVLLHHLHKTLSTVIDEVELLSDSEALGNTVYLRRVQLGVSIIKWSI
jgi:hypothetical protein